MKKCLIWGTGESFAKNIRLIQYYEHIEEIKIVGITSGEAYYDVVLNYPFIEKEYIDKEKFDILIIAAKGKNLLEIQSEAKSIGIGDENIIPIHVMAMPGFEIDKYISIKKNPPTILSPNCWGGITYNSLGLEFKSPLINMYMNHEDYIKFLKKLRYYLECPLEFMEMAYDSNLKKPYPVVRCADIIFHFNHYQSYPEALQCWNRRKERINWDNIIAMFFDDNNILIEEFCKLPYENKICFTSYYSKNQRHITINFTKEKDAWEVINEMAKGKRLYYDIFELILNNRFVPLIKLKSHLD